MCLLSALQSLIKVAVAAQGESRQEIVQTTAVRELSATSFEVGVIPAQITGRQCQLDQLPPAVA